jgi:glutathione S-transferase
MIKLWSYPVSPYAAKVRAVLRWKGLPFEETNVHPLKRGHLVKLTGRNQVPVLVDDDGTAVTDSTAIVRHLEQRHPERPVYPADPVLRARALLLEEWADEGLPGVVQPVRWLIKANRAKTMATFRGGYPAGKLWDALFQAVGQRQLLKERRLYGQPRDTDYLNRLGEVMKYLDGALAETGFLAGPAPSVADFAVYGFVSLLDGLDGWETVKANRRVAKLVKTIGGAAAEKEAYDASDEALLDASRLRRANREE